MAREEAARSVNPAGMAVEMSMDDYLDYETGGGRRFEGSFLERWKDPKKATSIDVWLHPKAPIARFFSHSWYGLGVDKEGHPKIGLLRFNSMESEVPDDKGKLRWVRSFIDNDGCFEYPAEVCPFGKLMDWVADQIAAEKIGWCDEIFRYEAGRDKRVIYAGGFVGQFGNRNLSDEDLDEIHAITGVTQRGENAAYKQDARARIQFLIRAISDEHPEDGCKIAIEGAGLSGAIQKCVKDLKVAAAATAVRAASGKPRAELDKIERDAMASVDPRVKPVCLRWRKDPEETNPGKQYSVVAMVDYAVNADLQEQFDKAPPDVNNIIGFSNVAVLRANFENHWRHVPLELDRDDKVVESRDRAPVTPPWDGIFAAAEEKLANTDLVKLPESFDHGANAGRERSGGRGRDDDRRSSREDDRGGRRGGSSADDGGTVTRRRGDDRPTRDERPPEREARRREEPREDPRAETKREPAPAAAPVPQVEGDVCLKPGCGNVIPETDAKCSKCGSAAPASCTQCNGLMFSDADTCPHCGAQYDENGNVKPKVEPAPEPRRARRSRSGS